MIQRNLQTTRGEKTLDPGGLGTPRGRFNGLGSPEKITTLGFATVGCLEKNPKIFSQMLVYLVIYDGTRQKITLNKSKPLDIWRFRTWKPGRLKAGSPEKISPWKRKIIFEVNLRGFHFTIFGFQPFNFREGKMLTVDLALESFGRQNHSGSVWFFPLGLTRVYKMGPKNPLIKGVKWGPYKWP